MAVASLPMYDLPEARPALDAFWARIALELRRAGLEAPARLTHDEPGRTLWSAPDLLFSQSCGYDLVHGFGGGYLPPVVTSRSHIDVPLPEITLQEGMTIVVQPNVVTRDGRAGVQTGELVLVTAEGSERLHASPPGLIVIDTADQPAGARR